MNLQANKYVINLNQSWSLNRFGFKEKMRFTLL